MSDECEYELNVLCEKLSGILTKDNGTPESQLINKKFSHVVRKVKNNGYLIFDSFISDVKTAFVNLRKNCKILPELEEVEKAFAEELNRLISMDYYKSGDDSDTSTSDSLAPRNKILNKTPKQKVSSKASSVKVRKKSSSETPTKVKITPLKKNSPSSAKKVKSKLTPSKRSTPGKLASDSDSMRNQIKTMAMSLLKVADANAEIHKAFTQLPSKTILLDYYDIIQLPISLSMIKDNIIKENYTSLYHCYSDIIIMCVNAKTYNEPHTEVYDMAVEVLSAVSGHMSSLSISQKSLNVDVKPNVVLLDHASTIGLQKGVGEEVFVSMWNLFCEVVKRCNKNGRPLAGAFLCLPDEKVFKAYYQKIKHPISLCGIRSKLICHTYENIQELVDDLFMLCENATEFNTKSSIISKDAMNLRDFVKSFVEKNPSHDKKNGSDIPNSPVSEKKVKLGEKRKINTTPRAKLSLNKSCDIVSPVVKKERTSKNTDTATPKIARVEHHSVEENVFSCFSDLKDKGDAIQSEMVRMCSAFHKDIENIVDLEDVLETTENCRNVLLKIVCAMSSRIDSVCPEFVILEDVTKRLINSDKDYHSLLQCVPIYSYNGKKYYLQEELMVIFRQTPFNNILSQSPNLTRITRNKDEIKADVPNLDIISDTVLFIECTGVTKTLQVPLFDKLKSSLPKPSPNDMNIDLFSKVNQKAGSADSNDDLKCKYESNEKAPKSYNRKATNMYVTAWDESIGKGAKGIDLVFKREKEIEQALSFLKSLKSSRDSANHLLFSHFLEIPNNKSYHSVIKYPMSLNAIEEGITSKTLKSVEDVISSCLLIIQNARYYNEESSEIHDCALKLERALLEYKPCKSTEVLLLSTRVMMNIVENLKSKTEISDLTKVQGDSKFVNLSFDHFCLNVKSGYYRRLDRFQDDLLHIIISNMNINQFSEVETKLLSIMGHYFKIRDAVTDIKSPAFDFTMKKFLTHYQDRLDVSIPLSATTCLTYDEASYMVGDKVRVEFSPEDVMVLHINVLSSPCWISGTVYFEVGDTLLKTDIKDIVHVKYVTEKVTKRYRYLSYNYRTRLASDITTNKADYCKNTFPSVFSCLSMSKYNNQTVIRATTDNKTLYYQFVRENGDIFKLGDFVYLNSDKELPYIARIDRIHKDKNDLVWVHGPWFIRPMDTAFYETQSFYPNEVFMSSISDVNHINSIEGHCEVLSSKDYAVKHPLSFLQKDIYICDRKYDESNHKFSKLPETKLYSAPDQSNNLEVREWFHFPKPQSIFKTLKPDFQKPLKVTVYTSSSESEDEIEVAEVVEESLKVDESPAISAPVPPAVSSSSSHQVTPIVKSKSVLQKSSLKTYTPQRLSGTGSGLQKPRVVLTNSSPSLYQTPKRVAIESKSSPSMNFSFSGAHNEAPLYQQGTPVLSSNTAVKRGVLTCIWVSCGKSFTNSDDFYKHVINTQTHLNGARNPQWKCYWINCTDRTARCEGMKSQILLRRHVLSHMADVGYTQCTKPQPPVILRHSDAYRMFINKLIQKKQSEQAAAVVVETVVDD